MRGIAFSCVLRLAAKLVDLVDDLDPRRDSAGLHECVEDASGRYGVASYAAQLSPA